MIQENQYTFQYDDEHDDDNKFNKNIDYEDDGRVILHCDLDAFYCQVEHVRLGISLENPLCVQQWQGLIAVNYAARKFGIQRHSTVEEARKNCPELRLVHVQTFAEGESEPKYHEHPTYAKHKVYLGVYRKASNQVFQILKRIALKVERASIDEAYMDLTEQIEKDINNPQILNEARQILQAEGTLILCNGNKGILDQKTMIASYYAHKMRKTIREELGYTCSIGISCNKTLAKLCSSHHKPNKQSILPRGQEMNFMKTISFGKIRNLGGKLGALVEKELNVDFASDIWKYPLKDLKSKFGEATGQWLYEISRGICREKVEDNQAIQSMAACKSFRPSISTKESLETWIGVLAAELATRLEDEYENSQRWPKTLALHYRPATSSHSSKNNEISRSLPMIPKRIPFSPDLISQKILQLITQQNLLAKILPCSRFSLTLGGFQKLEEPATTLFNYFNKATSTINSCQSPQEILLSCHNKNASSSHSSSSSSRPNEKLISSAVEDHVNEHIPTYSIPKEENLASELISDHSYTCSQCKRQILLVEQPEHEDYHLALSLYEQDQKDQRQALSSFNSNAPSASSSLGSTAVSSNKRNSLKRKSAPKEHTSQTHSKQKITNFFNKK